MIHAHKADSDCRETRFFLETLCSLFFFGKFPLKRYLKERKNFRYNNHVTNMKT